MSCLKGVQRLQYESTLGLVDSWSNPPANTSLRLFNGQKSEMIFKELCIGDKKHIFDSEFFRELKFMLIRE